SSAWIACIRSRSLGAPGSSGGETESCRAFGFPARARFFVVGVAARIRLLVFGFAAWARFLAVRCMKGNQVGSPKGRSSTPKAFEVKLQGLSGESGTDSSFVCYSAQTVSSTGFQAQSRERTLVNSLLTRGQTLDSATAPLIHSA